MTAVVGFADYFERVGRPWPDGMPTSVVVVGRNPWAGYSVEEAAAVSKAAGDAGLCFIGLISPTPSPSMAVITS